MDEARDRRVESAWVAGLGGSRRVKENNIMMIFENIFRIVIL